VDNGHGRFYTNLEETGQTVAIDVHKCAALSGAPVTTPSGIAANSKRGVAFVASSDHVIVLDCARSRSGRIKPDRDSVDNIDYAEETGLPYFANESGKPSPVALPTANGARSVFAGDSGSASILLAHAS